MQKKMTSPLPMLLSHLLNSDTPSYGNRDRLTIEQPSKISEGSSANSSKWLFSTNHLGTHIDMPNHFFEDGQTISDYPAHFWFCNNVQLIDIPVTEAELIMKNKLEGKINSKTNLLLIRTGYENYRGSDKYWNDNPGISDEVGFWIREKFPNIKMIGFDFLSLTSWKFRDEGKMAHSAFLNPEGKGNPICIIEDMSMLHLVEPIQQVIIAPLMVEKTNGSPVTVFAL